MLIVTVHIAGCLIVFFGLYKNSWWSDTFSMPVSSDDYEIEGVWCGFVHGTVCTSTRVFFRKMLQSGSGADSGAIESTEASEEIIEEVMMLVLLLLLLYSTRHIIVW